MGALSGYSALSFLAGSGCCDSDPADMGSRLTDVEAYLAAGGTIVIKNCDGLARGIPCSAAPVTAEGLANSLPS